MPFIDIAERIGYERGEKDGIEKGLGEGEIKALRELVLELFDGQHPNKAKVRKAIASLSEKASLKAIFDLLVARGSLKEIQKVLQGAT